MTNYLPRDEQRQINEVRFACNHRWRCCADVILRRWRISFHFLKRQRKSWAEEQVAERKDFGGTGSCLQSRVRYSKEDLCVRKLLKLSPQKMCDLTHEGSLHLVLKMTALWFRLRRSEGVHSLPTRCRLQENTRTYWPIIRVFSHHQVQRKKFKFYFYFVFELVTHLANVLNTERDVGGLGGLLTVACDACARTSDRRHR